MRIEPRSMLVIVAVVALVLVLMAGVSGTLIVWFASFQDWYMHLGMWSIISAYVLLYINASNLRRQVRRLMNLALLLLLGGFWVYILDSLIPARPVFRNDTLVERADMPVLMLPLALLVLGMGFALLHYVLGFFLDRSRPGDNTE